MFKATEVERKIREINLLINMQINLSSCRTSNHDISLSLQRLSRNSLGTKNLSSAHARNFWMVNKSWQPKRCGRIRVYPEIIQTSLLGRLQMEHNDYLYISSAPQWGSQETPNG